jgi:N-acetylmuramoyl-L-alanine amidase
MKRWWRDQVVVAILLLEGLGLSPGTVTAHGPESHGTYVTSVPVDVKGGPGETYGTIRKFRKGTAFEIVGKEGGWLKVQLAEHENYFGYVHERFAATKDQHMDINLRPAIPGTYMITAPISVRRGPGENFAVVSKLPKGTKIVVIGMEGDWLRIASKRGDPPAYVERKSTFLEHVD